jgi:hypothetical protein
VTFTFRAGLRDARDTTPSTAVTVASIARPTVRPAAAAAVTIADSSDFAAFVALLVRVTVALLVRVAIEPPRVGEQEGRQRLPVSRTLVGRDR